MIRKYLTRESTELIVHAFVTSRLDHCNSLLCGLPQSSIQKLQRVQNTAARIVTRTKKYDHITPVLQSLHWLPVSHRIMFKVLLTTYKALHGLVPEYLSELIHKYEPSRSLRSCDKLLLCVPKVNTVSFGERSFAYCGPKLWNSLPLNIRLCESVESFKAQLKAYLFNLYYSGM